MVRRESDAPSEAGEDEPESAPHSALPSAAASVLGDDEADEAEEYHAPHQTQGGATTEDLYKWAHQNRRPRRPRSESMHTLNTSGLATDVDRDLIKQPGGFRRSFVLNQAAEQGKPAPRAMRSFVDFLMLYGHFAGESLEEVDEEDVQSDDLEADYGSAIPGASSSTAQEGSNESSRLLQPRAVHGAIPAYRPRRQQRKQGGASVTEAVMMLLKSFVGTGILFLGKAFFNGGLLFSAVVLCAIAMVSLWSFLLLVEVNLKHPMGFGEMGGLLYGTRMRNAILFSIVFSQLGFVAAYTVFVAENMQSFVLSVTDCRVHVSSGMLILLQGLIFLPLSLIRRIAKLSTTALIADAFILLGLFYLFYYETDRLARDGLADVVLFNRRDFPLLIGTAVFTFEGIGLIIPITESMKEPQKFPRALTGVMFVVMVLFATSGVLSYATFGSSVQTVVFSNLPRNSHFVQVVQALYSVAILLSMPLQLFPALSILELGLFKRSGKYDWHTKMSKNAFRFCVVLFCMMCAWLGANDLDKFVSLIGSVACVPLCFVYPPLLHLRACATTRRAKVLDISLFIFGIFCVVFCGSQTVHSMLSAATEPKPMQCIPAGP